MSLINPMCIFWTCVMHGGKTNGSVGVVMMNDHHPLHKGQAVGLPRNMHLTSMDDFWQDHFFIYSRVVRRGQRPGMLCMAAFMHEMAARPGGREKVPAAHPTHHGEMASSHDDDGRMVKNGGRPAVIDIIREENKTLLAALRMDIGPGQHFMEKWTTFFASLRPPITPYPRYGLLSCHPIR